MIAPKEYRGNPDADPTEAVTVHRGMIAYPLSLRLDLRNHSPTGFAWGYEGSGPAQLALALLADVLRDDAALLLYQFFKRDVVARLPVRWSLTSHSVVRWVGAAGRALCSCQPTADNFHTCPICRAVEGE